MNYCTVALISHTIKVMLKILQARLQQYVNCELPDVQTGFRKGRGTRNQIVNIRWIIEKAREFSKTSTSALLTTPKLLTVWITTNCGKFLKRWGYQAIWPASWEIYMQVKKQQLKLDMEQQTGSKLGKECVKAVNGHSAYLTSMQSTWWETLGWMNHKLESRLPGEISITLEIQMTPPLWQKVKKNKEPFDESERGEWKSWLKTQHSENEDCGIWSHHFMGNRCGNNRNSDTLFFWAPKSLRVVTAAMELKDACSLGEKLWPT